MYFHAPSPWLCFLKPKKFYHYPASTRFAFSMIEYSGNSYKWAPRSSHLSHWSLVADRAAAKGVGVRVGGVPCGIEASPQQCSFYTVIFPPMSLPQIEWVEASEDPPLEQWCFHIWIFILIEVYYFLTVNLCQLNPYSSNLAGCFQTLHRYVKGQLKGTTETHMGKHPVCMFLNVFLKTFFIWTIFKIFIEFVTTWLLLCFSGGGQLAWGMWGS